MLTKKIFQEMLNLFSVNFNFEIKNEDGKIYKTVIYSGLKDKINDEIFVKKCQEIIEETSLEDWNKAYGFKGKPALKDWLNAIVPKPIKKTRKKECAITGAILFENYFDYPDWYLSILNQNKTAKIEFDDSLNKNNNIPYIEHNKTNKNS